MVSGLAPAVPPAEAPSLPDEAPPLLSLLPSAPLPPVLADLAQVLAAHRTSGQSALQVVCFGSSIGNLRDNAGQTPCNIVGASLRSLLNSGSASTHVVNEDNESVDGSVVFQFDSAWAAMASRNITPSVCVFVYGMNDAQTANYNSGESLSLFVSSMDDALARCATAKAAAIVITSPDGRVMNEDGTPRQPNLPANIPQVFPNPVPWPVPCALLVPVCAQGTVDLSDAGPASLHADIRFLQVNQVMRQLATTYGAVLVDAEMMSYRAIRDAMRLSGKRQYEIETLLYGPEKGFTVHPCNEGMQRFFSNPIAATLNALGGARPLTTVLVGVAAYAPSGVFDAGPLSGSGSVVQSGPGALLLFNVNTYTGGTTIMAGTLSIVADSGLGDPAGALNLGGGGKLKFYGINDLMTRPVAIGTGGGIVDVAITGFQLTMTGTISGPGMLTKSGGGTLVVAGTDNLVSDVNVQAGTLIASGTIPGSVAVGPGATLSGTGSIGPTTIAPAATLVPQSDSRGTLAITGDLTLAAGSTLVYDGSTVRVSGTASLGGTLAFDTTAPLAFGQRRTVLVASDGIAGTFQSGPSVPGINSVVNYTATEVFLTLERQVISASALDRLDLLNAADTLDDTIDADIPT